MMKSCQQITFIALLAGIIVSSQAIADVYKCTTFDGQSNHERIVYTDKPCGEQVKQTRINIPSYPIDTAVTTDQKILDLKVTQAVLARDFILAKSIATSKEHWRLISMAEGEHQPSIRTAPIVTAQVAARDQCAVARDDFESTSRTHRRDQDLIATKKTIMFAACGVAEPEVQNRTVVVGYPYGGIQSSRWVGTPYGPVIYHQPYNKYYNKHDSTHAQTGGGLSVNYQSKHFGISAKSYGTQKHTDIRQQFRTDHFGSQKNSDIRQQFR